MNNTGFKKDLQYYKFCLYGFLKNLRFFEFFLILFFVKEKELQYDAVMTLYAIRFFTRTIFEIPSGVIADSLGRKKTLILSFAGYIFSFVVYFVSAKYLLFIAASFLYGFADAFRTGTHKAMIFEYLKINRWSNHKVEYYGHTRSWSQIGSAVSSLAGAVIVVFTGNYKYVFLFSIIPYLAGMIILSTYPADIDKEIETKETSSVRSLIFSMQNTIHALKSFSKNLSLIRVSAFSGYYMAVKDLIQPMIVNLTFLLPVIYSLNNKQMSSLWIGLIYFIIYIVSAYASKKSNVFFSRFKQYYSALDILFIAGIIMGITAGMLTINENFIAPVILMMVIYAVENVRKPIGVSCLSLIYENNIMATMLSISSQIGSVLAALISLLVGFSIKYLGFGKGFAITSFVIAVLYIFLILTGKLFNADEKNHKH